VSFRDNGDLKKAKLWFRKALMQGDMDAALELGKTFIQCKARGSRKKARMYSVMAESARQISDEAREQASALISEIDAST
jgi:TPR repeat protein